MQVLNVGTDSGMMRLNSFMLTKPGWYSRIQVTLKMLPNSTMFPPPFKTSLPFWMEGIMTMVPLSYFTTTSNSANHPGCQTFWPGPSMNAKALLCRWRLIIILLGAVWKRNLPLWHRRTPRERGNQRAIWVVRLSRSVLREKKCSITDPTIFQRIWLVSYANQKGGECIEHIARGELVTRDSREIGWILSSVLTVTCIIRRFLPSRQDLLQGSSSRDISLRHCWEAQHVHPSLCCSYTTFFGVGSQKLFDVPNYNQEWMGGTN